MSVASNTTSRPCRTAMAALPRETAPQGPSARREGGSTPEDTPTTSSTTAGAGDPHIPEVRGWVWPGSGETTSMDGPGLRGPAATGGDTK